MDFLKVLSDILASAGNIVNAGWAGLVVLAIAVLAAVTAYIVMKFKASDIAKRASDEKAAKDHAENPIINDKIESGHQAAEDLINSRRPNGSS